MYGYPQVNKYDRAVVVVLPNHRPCLAVSGVATRQRMDLHTPTTQVPYCLHGELNVSGKDTKECRLIKTSLRMLPAKHDYAGRSKCNSHYITLLPPYKKDDHIFN